MAPNGTTSSLPKTAESLSGAGHLLLDVRGLVKAFGGVAAIDGLDISLQTGELRCIIGPNGAGKSTLFKLLTGVLRCDAGSIRFRGEDIARAQPFARARLGIGSKWQTLGVFPNLSVTENLAISMGPGSLHGDLPSRVTAVLQRVGLAGRGSHMAGELSHGEQQWLEIGMALAMNPSLLLLDEPTAGMSRVETQVTGEMVKRIHSEGTTIVVTEHDMAFVRQLDAPITVLSQGRVFAEGSHADIEADQEVRRIYLGGDGDGG